MLKRIILIFSLITMLYYPIVFADDEIDEERVNLDEIMQVSSNIDEKPSINSRAAVVIERQTGAVLYGKEENTKRKMASTTKIMTAIVVIQNADLSKTVEISKKAAGTGGSRLGLAAGVKITINDLLYGLMLCSGNDAAVALAEEVGGSIQGFAELMNKKADELGLKDTHFVTPHGLDQDEHYTTAYELACLTNYALNIEKFAQIVRTKTCTITINGVPKQIHNTNELLGYLNGVYGVKTGFTNGANRCLVTATKRGGLDIICVVLGADTKKFRTSDSVKLIEYTMKNYCMVDMENLVKDNANAWMNQNKIFVKKGVSDNLKLNLADIKYKVYPMKKWETDDIYMQVESVDSIDAPVESGRKVGRIIVYDSQKELFSVDIITSEKVAKKQVSDYFLQFIRNMCLFYEIV